MEKKYLKSIVFRNLVHVKFSLQFPTLHVKKPDGKAHEKGILLSSFLSPQANAIGREEGGGRAEGGAKKEAKVGTTHLNSPLKTLAAPWREGEVEEGKGGNRSCKSQTASAGPERRDSTDFHSSTARAKQKKVPGDLPGEIW